MLVRINPSPKEAQTNKFRGCTGFSVFRVVCASNTRPEEGGWSGINFNF